MKKNTIVLRKITMLFLIVVFSFVNFPPIQNLRAADDVSDIQSDLNKIEKKIDKTQQELDVSKAVYGKVAAQVGVTKNIIEKTAADIARKEAEIKNLLDQTDLNKKMLTVYLQELYFNNQEPVIKLAIANGNLNAVFGIEDQMLNVKEKILSILDEISASQSRLGEVKDELADKKTEHEELLQKKKTEQMIIATDIQEKQATLADLQKKFNKLQSDLNELMGASYDAKDIKDAVGFASDRTGVPKGVLYGFLTQESGRGKNVGQCTYADVKKVSIAGYKKYGKKYQASIDRLYYREKLFNDLLDNLGYSKKKVSCTIPFSSAGPNQGGAMGAAQFMSDTWIAYESRISAQTGHKNPDPWNITDAVMAMAIKIKAAGGTSDSNSAIRKSVTSYYGIFSQGYYNTVVYWAKNYKQLL